MTMGCASGCGKCCEEIFLHESVVEKADSGEVRGSKNIAFIAKHWSVIEHNGEEHFRMKCDVYDRLNKRCGDHENRPPICRDFPFYGGTPLETVLDNPRALLTGCSFWWDVPREMWDEKRAGRPLLPIREVNHAFAQVE